MTRHVAREIRSDSGAVAVMVAVMLVALLGVGALTVDAGAVYVQRRQLQTAADAAVLAGVLALPAQPDEALEVAEQYARLNTVNADELDFRVESSPYGSDDTLVAVLRNPDMGLFFARVLGTETAVIEAAATAMVGSPRTYGSGLMPFGIVANGTTTSPYGYATGGVIPLVVDQGDQSQGNWHYVDLTPFTDGANQTKAVIANGGTTDPVSIGTIIGTQPGAPNNPNFKALCNYFDNTCAPHGVEALEFSAERGVYEPVHVIDGSPCNRLITCPIIIVTEGDPFDWEGTAGASVSVEVAGFVNMFISNDPEAKDGTLMATFVQAVPDDVMTPGPYIPYGGIVTWLER